MIQMVSAVVGQVPYFATFHGDDEGNSNALVFGEDRTRPLPDEVVEALVNAVRATVHLENPERLAAYHRVGDRGCIYFSLPPH